MKKKYATLLAGVIMACSASSFAADMDSDTQSTEKKDTSFFAPLVNKLGAASASLSSQNIQLDDVYFNEKYDAYIGDDVVPVTISGTRFLVRKDGKEILRPSGVFFVNEQGFQLGQNQLLKMDMSPDSTHDWPTIKVPEGVEKRGDVFVLSDPTCGYCHKVEQEVDLYLANGIQVHYIPYPRSGVNDINAEGMGLWATAACAENPGQAYHDISLNRGEKYTKQTDINAECVDVVRKGYAYGVKIGVTGTPFMHISTDSGESFSNPGYMPFSKLLPIDRKSVV